MEKSKSDMGERSVSRGIVVSSNVARESLMSEDVEQGLKGAGR